MVSKNSLKGHLNLDHLSWVLSSSMDDDERLLIGFAPSLVAVKLPAMLAMQEPVAVDTTRAFAQTFYKQLLQYGRSVKLNLYSPP